MKSKNKSANLTKTGLINYPMGDFLIRLKNAGMGGLKEVIVKNSKLIKALATSLKKEGFIESLEEKEGNLIVVLSFRRKQPVLMDVKLVSKPGLRVYMGAEELKKEKGPSIIMVSTPLGIMAAKDAVKKRIGGEVIAEIL